MAEIQKSLNQLDDPDGKSLLNGKAVSYNFDEENKTVEIKKALVEIMENDAYGFVEKIFQSRLYSAFHKHNSFFEESEYRIAYVPNETSADKQISPRCFRCTKNKIIPFYKLNVPSPARILVGSKNSMDRYQIQDFLTACALPDDIAIIDSASTYR